MKKFFAMLAVSGLLVGCGDTAAKKAAPEKAPAPGAAAPADKAAPAAPGDAAKPAEDKPADKK